MIALAELVEWNSKTTSRTDCLDALLDLYGVVPSKAPICQYLIKKLATIVNFTDATMRALLEDLPPALLVDFLTVLSNCDRNRKDLAAELRVSCDFHDHHDHLGRMDCGLGQLRDATFYLSFFRACMDRPMKQKRLKRKMWRDPTNGLGNLKGQAIPKISRCMRL